MKKSRRSPKLPIKQIKFVSSQEEHLRRQIREELTVMQSHFAAYFEAGEDTIIKTGKELEERVTLLFYLASEGIGLAKVVAEIVPDAKAQAISVLCAAAICGIF